MVFRTRILQDVAEYAIRTADRGPVGGDHVKEPPTAEPPSQLSRTERTSANLTSASAIALGPWAVFALSFLILAAYRDEIGDILDPSLSEAIDLDGLGDLSRVLAGEPTPVPMFGQTAQETIASVGLSSDDAAHAPTFGDTPLLTGPSAGPFALALLPDEIFNFNLTDEKNGLNALRGDDLTKHFSVGSNGRLPGPEYTPAKFDPDKDDTADPNPGGGAEDGGNGGENGGQTTEDGGLVVNGSAGDDNLVGTEKGDLIFNYTGADNVVAMDGDDVIVSGGGFKSLDGGAGFDVAAFLTPSTDYVIYRNADGSLTLANEQLGDEIHLVGIETIYFADGNYDVAKFGTKVGLLDVAGAFSTNKTSLTLMDEYGGGGGPGEVDTDPNDDMDIIVGDATDNSLIGTGYDELFLSGAGNDIVQALGGNDIVIAGSGNNLVDGGEGFDIAGFTAPSSSYEFFRKDDGSLLVRNLVSGDETVVRNVERLYFTDGFVDLTSLHQKPGFIDISGWIDTSERIKDVVDPALVDQATQGGGGDGESGDGDVIILVPNITTVLSGDAKDDDLTGTDGSDLIFGGPGNDRLDGLAGDDILVPGDGFDIVDGGDGRDLAAFQEPSTSFSLYLMSDGSFSLINNATNEETVLANVEELFFGDGYVTLSGIDQLGLVDLADELDTSATTQDLMDQLGAPGGGDDDGTVILQPGTPGETIVGDAGDNDLYGTDGGDVIVGGPGNDRIAGFGGADIVVAGPGFDIVDGGDGQDAAAFDGASKIYALYGMSDGSFSLINETTNDETVLRNVEQIYFSDGFVDISELQGLTGRIDMGFLLDGSATSADLLQATGIGGAEPNPDLGIFVVGDGKDNDLVGTDRDDLFIGNAGNDRISGLGGEDVIIADPGSDLIDGGDGTDIAGFSGASTGYSLYSHGDGSFTVQASKGGDATELVNVESLYFADGNVDLTALPGTEGVVHMGDLLDTDATVDDLFDLGDQYPTGGGGDIGGGDDPTDPILVLVPPPVYTPPIETMTNPETGESV